MCSSRSSVAPDDYRGAGRGITLTKGNNMATIDETHKALVDKIHKLANSTNSGTVILQLAEAYAWVASPSQAHGGTAAK